MTGFPPEVQRGLTLALEAERKGLLSRARLDEILAYYDREGGVLPAPASEVLQKLGGLSAAQLAQLLGLSPSGFQPRELTPRLLLLDPLGEGGMGTVYKAQDRVLKRVVAVKLIKQERLASQQALQRFEREALVMARVQHPACVPVYDAGVADGQPYLVMKFVPGRSLRDALQEQPQGADPRRVARWGQRLAEGLQACHEAGVVHRDVKPGNALLDEQDQPLLTDFGVALDGEARTKLTQASGAVGTFAYMPPEQAAGEPADPRSDVYSLGASLYEALSGRVPFEADQPLALLRLIADEPPRGLREARPEVPQDLERVVLKCLEKAPADRYSSAQALALDLARFLAGEPVAARPIGPLGRLARRARRHQGALLALATAGVALAIGLGLWAAGTRRAARAVAASELAALSSPSDLRAAETALARLALDADPWIASRGEAALRELRLRNQLAQAQAALDRLVGLVQRQAEARSRLEELTLFGRLDERLPVGQSPEKQERLRLQRALESLPFEYAEALAGVSGALASAEALRGGPAVERLRARLLLQLARVTLERDPAAAEEAFQRAERADTLSGGGLRGDLAPTRLEVTSLPPATLRLERLVPDPALGQARAEPLRSGSTPVALALPAGEYQLEVALPGFLPLREVLVVGRGERRRLEFRLLPARQAGSLSEDVVALPGGPARTLRTRFPDTGACLMARTEVTLEAWRSHWLAQGRPTDGLPERGGGRDDLVAILLDPARRRLPVFGVRLDEARGWCRWLEGELALAALPLRCQVPKLHLFHRAVRGELPWTFPWGRWIDPSFCACSSSQDGSLTSVTGYPIDTSPYGVQGLAGNVSEWVESDVTTAALGGSVTETHEALERWMLYAGSLPPDAERPDVGFRYVLLPTDAPAPLPPVDARVPWLAEAQRHLRAGKVTEALAAARSHVAVAPREATRWVERGRIRLAAQDTWGAWFDATQATLLAPKLADAWYLRGQVERARREPGNAAAEYDRALALEPGLREVYYRRAAARSDLGQLEPAIADLERFVELTLADYGPAHPDVATGREGLATLRARLERERANAGPLAPTGPGAGPR